MIFIYVSHNADHWHTTGNVSNRMLLSQVHTSKKYYSSFNGIGIKSLLILSQDFQEVHKNTVCLIIATKAMSACQCISMTSFFFSSIKHKACSESTMSVSLKEKWIAWNVVGLHVNSRRSDVASLLALFVRDWLSKFYSHVTKCSSRYCTVAILLYVYSCPVVSAWYTPYVRYEPLLFQLLFLFEISSISFEHLFHQVFWAFRRPPHNLHDYIH